MNKKENENHKKLWEGQPRSPLGNLVGWKNCHFLPTACFCMLVGWCRKENVGETPDKNIRLLWNALRDLPNKKKITKTENSWSVVYDFLTVSRDGGISVNSNELKSFFTSWETAVKKAANTKNNDEVKKYEKVFEVSSAAN